MASSATEGGPSSRGEAAACVQVATAGSTPSAGGGSLALKERTTRTGRPLVQDSFSALFMLSKVCGCFVWECW